jgi:murein L,D-transpeptidase YcbB/YkuD
MISISNKTAIYLLKSSILFVMACCFLTSSYAQPDTTKEDPIVQKFYAVNHEPLYWLSSDKSRKRATEWLTMMESSDQLGITLNNLQSDQVYIALLDKNKADNINKEQRDRQITGLVLNFMKHLQEGNIKFDYDEVNISRDSVYIHQLLSIKAGETVSQTVTRLDCKDHDYMVLKEYLHDSIAVKDSLKYKKVVLAMNYRRYFTANHPTEYIVANIPATEASYYRNDFLKLKMRTVVGRKENPTPLIASYITNVVTFPKWNVPHSIAVKELLPKVQNNENYLEQNNFEVVNGKGKVIDDSELKWKNYTETNFPYFFRQATGARNSLGVLKFNLQNPFSIFLHSTSWQGAFAKDYRFLSHGCIRLAKPLELAKTLLPDKIDIKQLRSGKKNTESKTIALPHKIPVFIIYMPVTVVGKKVIFLNDVYGLIK